jgi:hypothetical protein
LLLLVDTPGHSAQASVVQAGRILQSLRCSGVVTPISADSESDRRDQIQDAIRGLTSSFAQEADKNIVHLLDTVDDTRTTLSR